MAAKNTVKVPHLGISAGYRISNGIIDPAKPTVVLINSMCMTSALYDVQYGSKAITDAVNLLAIEPLGHGATSSPTEHFTYWDTAIMALQVMDAFKVDKAFALGTSQGGWIVARMALLAPERILGILPLGTSMDYESAASRAKGSWDPDTTLAPVYEALCSDVPTPDFVPDHNLCLQTISLGFSGNISDESLAMWVETLKQVYSGDEGRKKLKMAMACLLDRDSLLRRVRDIKCPVYWLQGTQDIVFGTAAQPDQIKLFTGSPEAELIIVEGELIT
ncbi:hypothetical protein PT974_05496 [Cladobotryum mycophilum]|uniref:AB hydrolase-1 domain-containing protein n=1 Tax=Cladobotryum mycophilum TaxID=491253 RepID=A0ABR0SIZ2_9HYPO